MKTREEYEAYIDEFLENMRECPGMFGNTHELEAMGYILLSVFGFGRIRVAKTNYVMDVMAEVKKRRFPNCPGPVSPGRVISMAEQDPRKAEAMMVDFLIECHERLKERFPVPTT